MWMAGLALPDCRFALFYKACLEQAGFEESLAKSEAEHCKAEMLDLNWASLLIFCWERTEARDEPELLSCFRTQSGLDQRFPH